MLADVHPAPSDEEREAILAALDAPPDEESGWSAAALLEGVEEADLGP